ncbi:MAG: hypothetical protein VKI83_01915 [Synechococcaceae cyanobacterium]|nr:hypothetical protein [Synechococcaceae cyanobacterium]
MPRRRDRSGPSVPALLHHLDALLTLAGLESRPSGLDSRQPLSSAQRRRQQRLALAQRLLDPLPAALRPPAAHAELAWTLLRWGGLGLILATWLRP